MKKHIIAFGFALIIVACGQPASRDDANDGSWLATDGRAYLCLQELRNRNIIPMAMPVAYYADNVNIVQIRANNPGVYSVTESEFKGLCRGVGIDLDAPVTDSPGPRDR